MTYKVDVLLTIKAIRFPEMVEVVFQRVNDSGHTYGSQWINGTYPWSELGPSVIPWDMDRRVIEIRLRTGATVPISRRIVSVGDADMPEDWR